MNTLTFIKDGLKWSRITNNLWGAMVKRKNYIFIEVTPLNGKYKVKYRNIEIKRYEKQEINLMRQLYNVVQADYTLAFVLGQHYDHYEWIEECNDLKELADLIEKRVTFDFCFLGDVDASGVPDINKNIFRKIFKPKLYEKSEIYNFPDGTDGVIVYWVDKDGKEHGPRTCSDCDESMWTGHVINDGDEHCCVDCIHKRYTSKQLEEMYEDDTQYYTEWDESELMEDFQLVHEK
ncbi:hypothetical protein ACQKNX_23090 [Lysinibacillus sp. NPDC093712]|uniref:hypothetical protein n=1 Tax=Lysinibacillus sp. NPDC093712 TaxID=3390579 RepID=UPI003D01975C